MTVYKDDIDLRLLLLMEEGAGEMYDYSGHGNNLQRYNGVGLSTDAKEGNYSGDFDRASQQYLAISDANQNGLDPGGSFSAGMWVKCVSQNDTHRLITKYDTAGDQRGFQFNVEANGSSMWLGCYVSNDGATWSFAYTAGGTISLNTWHHVVVVYDDSAGEVRLYIDKTLASNGSNNPKPHSGGIFNTTVEFRIGSRVGSSDYLDGLADEAFFIRRALSLSEIEDIHDTGFLDAPTTPGSTDVQAAIWVQTWEFVTATNPQTTIDTIIANCAPKFSDIFLGILHLSGTDNNGYCIGRSNYFHERTETINGAPLLDYFVDQAHANGMRVHLWHVVGHSFGVYRGLRPAYALPTSWNMANNGDSPCDAVSWPDLTIADCRNRIIDAIVDIQEQNPDVDGCHLDYIRFHKDAVPCSRASDSQITHIVSTVKSRLPAGQMMSCAVLGSAPAAYGGTKSDNVHQDIDGWTSSGLVDFLGRMRYYDDPTNVVDPDIQGYLHPEIIFPGNSAEPSINNEAEFIAYANELIQLGYDHFFVFDHGRLDDLTQAAWDAIPDLPDWYFRIVDDLTVSGTSHLWLDVEIKTPSEVLHRNDFIMTFPDQASRADIGAEITERVQKYATWLKAQPSYPADQRGTISTSDTDPDGVRARSDVQAVLNTDIGV